jgi:hypothetical protein
MPLQHQEHETSHDQRLQLGVTRIITTTREVLKRQVISRFEISTEWRADLIESGERRRVT